jgi:diacylglycerol kinase (ATP)
MLNTPSPQDQPNRNPLPQGPAEQPQELESPLSGNSLPAIPDAPARLEVESPALASNLRIASHDKVIFRGSFNPFHEGHLDVVRELLNRGYTTVVISPVSFSPGKGRIDTPKELRAEMILKILEAEGVQIAKTPDEPGVYVIRDQGEARRELTRAILSSKTDFAMGNDNDATYSEHKRWKMVKRLGEGRLAIVCGSAPVHSSAIRRGETPPHPAIRDVILAHDLYPQARVVPPTLTRLSEVVVLYNPISGSGKGKEIAAGLQKSFEDQDIRTTLRPSSASYSPGELAQEFKGKDLVIIVGGDGTMMGALKGISEAGIPVYMVPAGNESLFSKLFEMKKERAQVLDDISKGAPKDHFYGVAGDKPFFLMMSVGLDSMIIDQIGERSGPSSNWMYVQAALGVMLKYRTPVVSLKVDGKEVINNESGYLIFGNTPSYGRNLNLVPEASSSEQKLHVRFFPQTGLWGEIAKGIKMAFRQPADLEGSRLYSGESFELTVHNGPYPIQADGDFLMRSGDQPIKIEASKRPIRVWEK